MEYGDFYDLAEYANESWNGSYTEKEVAENAMIITVISYGQSEMKL